MVPAIVGGSRDLKIERGFFSTCVAGADGRFRLLGAGDGEAEKVSDRISVGESGWCRKADCEGAAQGDLIHGGVFRFRITWVGGLSACTRMAETAGHSIRPAEGYERRYVAPLDR